MTEDAAVVLRDWVPADGDWYVAQLGDEEIQRFTVETVDTTAADFRAALAGTVGAEDVFARAIVDPLTGDLAGNLAASRRDGAAEVHYWLAEPARGRGLATAAVQETVGWVQQHWPDVTRLHLTLRAGNEASARVAARVGFERDPGSDRTIEVRGETWSMLGYSRPAHLPCETTDGT